MADPDDAAQTEVVLAEETALGPNVPEEAGGAPWNPKGGEYVVNAHQTDDYDDFRAGDPPASDELGIADEVIWTIMERGRGTLKGAEEVLVELGDPGGRPELQRLLVSAARSARRADQPARDKEKEAGEQSSVADDDVGQ